MTPLKDYDHPQPDEVNPPEKYTASENYVVLWYRSDRPKNFPDYLLTLLKAATRAKIIPDLQC